MPRSLTIGSSAATGSIKRQRSAGSRGPPIRSNAPDQRRSDAQRLNSNVRIPAYLEKTRSEIAQTFQDLEWKQRFRLFHALENPHSSPFRVDRSAVVISRNRYGNVQPWDQSRIKLKIPIGGSDYVNASPILLKRTEVTVADQSPQANIVTSFRESKYIATQGPKADQLTHFWYMVHQETTGSEGVIVMLTQCYEANKEKCAIYFPTSLENPELILHHDEPVEEDQSDSASYSSDNSVLGTVTLISALHDSSLGCDVRVLDVAIADTTKRIHHYLFNGWPDFGRPEAEDRIALLNLTRKTYEVAQGSPRIVHCSAGVGRTGTFIALDFLIREIEEGRFIDSSLYPSLQSPTYATHPDHNVNQVTPTETWGKSGPPKVRTPTLETGFMDESEHQSYRDDLIYSTVNTLREQRMMMVMNEIQYALLYEIVREVFWENYSVRPEGAVVQSTNSTATDDGPPKSKVLKVEGDGSGSEAETEIMEDKSSETSISNDVDPYGVVAPEQIREGMKNETQ